MLIFNKYQQLMLGMTQESREYDEVSEGTLLLWPLAQVDIQLLNLSLE
jgi:hypothetical protein